jgi:hypothetical protein
MSWNACRWTKRGKASVAKGLRRAGQLIADQPRMHLVGGGGAADRAPPPPTLEAPGAHIGAASVPASLGGSIEQAFGEPPAPLGRMERGRGE